MITGSGFTNMIVQIQPNILGHGPSRIRKTKLFPSPTKIFLYQMFYMKVPQMAVLSGKNTNKIK